MAIAQVLVPDGMGFNPDRAAYELGDCGQVSSLFGPSLSLLTGEMWVITVSLSLSRCQN